MDQIAVLGPKGTFSDRAAALFLDSCDTVMQPFYCRTIDRVVYAVGNGCRCGIIPLENTLDGYVQRTLDLLLEEKIHVLQEIVVPVQFSLAANAGSLKEIRRLYVHGKAWGQCRRFIDSLGGCEIVNTDSNMDSHQKVMEGRPGEAAVIPSHTLPGEGGQLLVENITDAADNHTRFVVVRQGELEPVQVQTGQRIRALTYVIPETDRPGLLFDILKVFRDQDINLVSIMSRPTRQAMGRYNFYIELDGTAEDQDKMLRAVIALKAKHGAKILGVYAK